LLERIPEVQQFPRVTVESDELLNFDRPQELKSLSQKFAARLARCAEVTVRAKARLVPKGIGRIACLQTAPRHYDCQ
jgi:hypothetical protein